MPLDFTRARPLLQQANLTKLFVEELGWDRSDQAFEVNVEQQRYRLQAIAKKCGLIAYRCVMLDGSIPDYRLRLKVQREVSRITFEHILVFTAGDNLQSWLWVRREPGRPIACRTQDYHADQSGDPLLQKLQLLAVSLEEEEAGITLPDITRRVRAAFDVERVTRRFYDRFKTEHAAFLAFIKGIPDAELHRWYASVMLNRLMFVYFIQKKGFLNGDPDYLRNKLAQSRQTRKNSFYSEFLCPLFFEGFAKKARNRSAETNQLLGKVPYLNGGIFQRHQIEELHGEKIQVADAAFEGLFDFFDQYQWHLDERPLRRDNEINPDVLGFIFEKYINQKQMGAYYTQEDITGYNSAYTILPFLFEVARAKCKVAFEGENSVWTLLQADPDRYIYPAVKKGVELKLPAEIADGIKDVSKRTEWNKPAHAEYALPTEIWREVVARRQRYEEIRKNLATGEITDINDFITYNLDIRQFAQDVIENAEPDLLSAFYAALLVLTVLDPTCGSGAFLFAALNILYPLYEACLNRMALFVEEWERTGSKAHPNYAKNFKAELSRLAAHQNEPYFILKTIIVNNLYGVDIMDEAVEICKLRLFLKLVAQVESADDVEPLPDIDFNIRAGNTLVGYATYDEVKRAVTSKLDFDNALAKIEDKAALLQSAFEMFRRQQTELGGEVTPADKRALRQRLESLEAELNRHLATEYGVDATKPAALATWLHSYKPFHWFIEFYGIIKGGGFHVIVGNPPYLELREVEYAPRGFHCADCGAIHAMCMERSVRLLHADGSAGMIVPLSLVSTQRMGVVQEILEEGRHAWYANFSWRPAKMFDTVNRALTIFTVTTGKNGRTFSTNYHKWTSDNRDLLMQDIEYIETPLQRPAFWIPKLGEPIERAILEKGLAVKTPLSRWMRNSQHRVYYRTDGGLYWKVFTDFAPAFKVNGKAGHSTRETWFTLPDAKLVQPVIAALSSDFFWWWYTVTSNCRHLNPYDIQNFPLPESAVADAKLAKLGKKYLDDLVANSTMAVREQRQTGRTQTQSFKIQKSKPVIDEIDRVLAEHYGLTAEELDFIINYDIKYRLGRDSQDEEK